MARVKYGPLTESMLDYERRVEEREREAERWMEVLGIVERRYMHNARTMTDTLVLRFDPMVLARRGRLEDAFTNAEWVSSVEPEASS